MKMILMIKNKKYWSLVGGVRLRSRLGTDDVQMYNGRHTMYGK